MGHAKDIKVDAEGVLHGSNPGGLNATLAVLANGPIFIMEALQMALPGIDANDLDKMSNTLRFFEQVAF